MGVVRGAMREMELRPETVSPDRIRRGLIGHCRVLDGVAVPEERAHRGVCVSCVIGHPSMLSARRSQGLATSEPAERPRQGK